MLSPVRFVAAFAVLTIAIARAQLAPPPQTYAAAIGTAPLRANVGAELTASGRFTLEGWVYLTAPTPFGFIMGKGLATAGADPFVAYALMLNDDGTRVTFAASTGAPGTFRNLTAPDALPLRTWTHLAAVVDGNAARLLVNGQVSATTTLAGPVANPDVSFGLGSAYLANGNSNYPSFSGLARQVRLWSLARSDARIAADAILATPADRTGLYANWALDQSSGSGAPDTSGNNRALIGGGAWTRLAVIDAGAFFSVTSTVPSGNVLADSDDGILIDFDGDGDPDLLTFHLTVPPTVPETRRRLRAFRNTNGTFADATDAVLGTITMVHPRDRHVADFNGDGRADLLIVGHGTDTPPFPGEQAKLLIQSVDGRLVDETATRLPQRSSFTHNLAVGDIEGDGDLDAYVANVYGGDVGPRFYLNNGAGVFTEATDRLPADVANRSNFAVFTAAALVDVNGDSRPDLVLGSENTYATNDLLLNDGTGRFARNPAFVLPPKLFGPVAVTVQVIGADLNADGAQDLLLSTTGGSVLLPDGRTINGYSLPGVQLLLNRGNGTFYDATAQLNLSFNPASDTWIEWVRIADLNADARPDLVLQGAPSSTGQAFSRTILLNRGGAVFVDASEAYAGGSVTYLQPGDVDRDGLVDLVGVNSNAIVVSRALKPLDRALFQTTADDPGRLANLSVRTQAGTDDQTLITGFALSGGTATKQLLVRAVGPALEAFGVNGVLDDPRVEIALLGGASVASNDDWSGARPSPGAAELSTVFDRVGAFRLPVGSPDAALTFSPAPGSYTAKVTGANNGTGVALVEVYDAGTGNAPRLTNVSARTQVGTGGDVLIVGFAVTGNVPRKLLIRAVGPTLGTFGVGGTLADPVLAVRKEGDENIVASNDDWRGAAALKTAFTTVGAFALDADTSSDAALAIELPPGVYTVTVSGKADTTGVALVEVYELP